MAKGVVGDFQAELGVAEIDPRIKFFCPKVAPTKNRYDHNENRLIDCGSDISKIVAVSVLGYGSYFCKRIAFCCHHLTLAAKNTVKNARHRIFVNGALVPPFVTIISPLDPSQYLFLFPSYPKLSMSIPGVDLCH